MNVNLVKWRSFKLHAFHAAALLVLTVLGGSIVLGLIVDKAPFIQAFDRYFYQLLSSPSIHNRLLDILIYPFNFNFLPRVPLAMPSFLVIYIFLGLLLVGVFNRRLIKWYVFCVILGTIIAYVITAIDWIFVFRTRPFVNLPNHVEDYAKNIWVNYSSFPSGHVRETALYSVIIYNFVTFLKWFLIVFIVFIGFSRVYVGAHYPTDAIAGGLMGFLVGKSALIIAREVQILYENRGGKDSDKPKKTQTR